MKFLRFNRNYFALTVILFVIEICIAIFVNDAFVRPFLGDVIVVWFMYYFIRSFIAIKPIYIAFFTLLFSFAVEIGQYFKLIEILGLQENKWARIVIGTSFSWWDLLCYVVGFLLLFLMDNDLKMQRLIQAK